jgi:hypothetical protein
MSQFLANARAANAIAIAHEKNQQANHYEGEIDRVVSDHNRIVNKYNTLLDQHQAWVNYVHENAEGNRLASEGNTVAGYTNNLAQELGILKFDLMHSFYKQSHTNTCLALPYSGLPERYETYKRMTMEHRKYINLRMMCRAEWYDWCLHIDVLSKASQAVVKAMMDPTKENAVLRSRSYLNDLDAEITAYHALRDQAMDVTRGVSVRDAFETERVEFWNDKIRFYIDKDDRDCPVPKTDLTAEANPGIRFDLHLPAGRLTKKWKIDIVTGKPAEWFRNSSAGSVKAGHGDLFAAGFYL